MIFKKGKRVLIAASNEPELPPLRTRAKNFVKAVARNAASVAKGNALEAPVDVAIARLKICEGCEWYRASDGRCAHPKCGCFLRRELLNKVRLLAEKCPIEKW